MMRLAVLFSVVAILFDSRLLAGEVLYPPATNTAVGQDRLIHSDSGVVRAGGVDTELHRISNLNRDVDLTAQWPEVGLYVRRLPVGFCMVKLTVGHDREFTPVPSDVRLGEDLDLVASAPLYVARETAERRKGLRTRDAYPLLKSEISRSGTNDKLRCCLMFQSTVEGSSIKYTAKFGKRLTQERLRFAIPFLTDLWEKRGLERDKESTVIELSSQDAELTERSSLVTYGLGREERTVVIQTRSGATSFRPHVVPAYVLWQDEIILAGRLAIHGPKYED